MLSRDLFPDLFLPFTTTAHFSEATIQAVWQNVTVKNGRPCV